MEPSGAGAPPSPLAARIAEHELFRSLDRLALADLAAELTLVRLAPGEILFRQGDPGDGMYVLVEGGLSVRFQPIGGAETIVNELRPPASAGEIALLTGQPRSATVVATAASELVRLSLAGFARLAQRHPGAMHEFAQTIVPHLHRTQLAGILTDLFGPIEPQALHSIQSALAWRHLPAGEILFRQSEPGDALAIVVNGRLRIVAARADGDPQTVGEVSRGECVGEFALLTGRPRSATVCAIRDTDVVMLSQELFEQLLGQYPRAMLRIARFVVDHAQGGARLAGSATTTTFALIPAGPSAPLAEVARRLAEALSAFGPTLHLSAGRIDEVFSRAGAAQARPGQPADVALKGWLSEQEAVYRYIVYQADHTWSPWTQRCLGQADRALFVASAADNPAPGPIEAEWRRSGGQARAELVLIHPDGCPRPAGTAAWLTPRHVHTHHHARLGAPGDFRRLARRLTGRALGLVLSGGGARGHAHIGAIRALEEAGIAVDMIGGTSMGALIGAGYATGRDYRQMVDLAAAFSARRRIFDFTLPLTSFIAGRKISSLYRELFEDVQIEDLWRPFFAISSNLTRAEPVLHQRGPVWLSVRSSTAIPGVFAPVLLGGDVLVDGGVMNNFPIDIMRQDYEAGTVLGVNVSPPTEKLKHYRFGESVSGWQVLWSRISPLGGRLRAPSLLASLMRATEINGAYKVRAPAFQRLADLIVQPPVARFHPLAFEAYQEIIEAGYSSTRADLEAWLSVGPEATGS